MWCIGGWLAKNLLPESAEQGPQTMVAKVLGSSHAVSSALLCKFSKVTLRSPEKASPTAILPGIQRLVAIRS